MSSKKGILWPAAPHTIAKIQILEEYLFPYFQIMGRTNPSEIFYVDGFAGPGKYTNYDNSSPLAALRSALRVVSVAGSEFIAKNITCIFIEKDTERFEHLVEHVKPFDVNPKIKIILLNSDFENSIEQIKAEYGKAMGVSPSFYFVDPFGATGAPFKVIQNIMKNPKAELFLNLDADGINRIFKAGEAANSTELLDNIFGDRSDWRTEFGEAKSDSDRGRRSLKIYKSKLRKIDDVNYAFAFEMRSKGDRLDYFLLFATHHRRGLEKMKEAMRRIAGNTSYTFSDAREGQHSLFAPNEKEEIAYFADQLHLDLQGKDLIFNELWDYALNETPFLNPKKMLAYLQQKGFIKVIEKKGAQIRPSTFPEDKISSISIAPYENNLFH